MSKTYKILIGFLLLLLGVFVYLESSRPEPVDWTPSFSIHDKIPFGTYVFYESIKEKWEDLKPVSQSPYEFFGDPEAQGSYVLINGGTELNEEAQQRMKEWVKKGNTLFLAAPHFSLEADTTFNLETKWGRSRQSLKTKPELTLVNPALQKKNPYRYDRDASVPYFSKIDTLGTKLLGEVSWAENRENTKKEANFIEISLGKGKILVHTMPLAFTNFFMLQNENYEYVEKVLAYLPTDQPIFYDVYFDPNYQKTPGSPLFVLFNNRHLKWGYYFLIFGALLFILFEGKRKQKAIPVIPPLENASYAYTQTVSGLYLDAKDHKAIGLMKIQQFLEFIRTDLHTPTSSINQVFYERLAAVTEVDILEIKELFADLDRYQTQEKWTKNDLIALNKMINDFKNNC